MSESASSRIRRSSLRQRIGMLFTAPGRLFDVLAGVPEWKRTLAAYLVASASMLTLAGLADSEYGIEAIAGIPVAGGFVMLVAAHAFRAASAVINAPLYFVALAGTLLVVSRVRPGPHLSFRQLFSLTVHAAYVLLAGHALRLILALCGVDASGPAAALLPLETPPVSVLSVTWSDANGPPVGIFETSFHAMLGAAYCHARNRKRMVAGAALGAGLSLSTFAVWLILGTGR